MAIVARPECLRLLLLARSVICPAGRVRGDCPDWRGVRPGLGSTPDADALGMGITFRVWAPKVTSVAVRGPFNVGGWNNTSNLLVKESGGLGL